MTEDYPTPGIKSIQTNLDAILEASAGKYNRPIIWTIDPEYRGPIFLGVLVSAYDYFEQKEDSRGVSNSHHWGLELRFRRCQETLRTLICAR